MVPSVSVPEPLRVVVDVGGVIALSIPAIAVGD